MTGPTPSTLPMVWARVRKEGAHILRRGAWYNVIREKEGMVLLEVNKEIVPMSKEFVTLAREKPTKWSVVARDPDDYGARRGSLEKKLDATYVVCPGCRARANVEQSAVERTCPQCHGVYPVDWGDPC